MPGVTRLLVTGASGFVGGALVRRAVRDARPVRGALRSGARSLPAGAERVVIQDVGPETDWSAALADVDAVIHAAARVHVLDERAADPLAQFRRVNTAGTLALAKQAAAAGVRRFVFVSTIGVNGLTTDRRPFTADDSPAPHSDYARSKAEAERDLRSLASETGMEVVVVRPPLVIGPDAPGNFDRLLGLIHRGVPLPFGAVSNRRSFVGVENLVDLLLVCADHPAAANETLLVSDDEDVSTPMLLRRVARALDKPARLFPVPTPLVRAALRAMGRGSTAAQLCGSLQVDVTRTKQLLGWTPRWSLDAELQRSAAAFGRRHAT